MATENREKALHWWNTQEESKQIEFRTKYIGPYDERLQFHMIQYEEIEYMYDLQMEHEREQNQTKYIYRPESKITKDKIVIYGAGKFNEEKLILNKTEAVMLLVELHKFINQE